MLSDYNCRIFDISKFDILSSRDSDVFSIELEKAKNDILLLTKNGFHTFYCPIRYNDNFSVAHTKRSLTKLKKLYLNALPRGCGKISINFVPKLYLSKDAPYVKSISSLAIKNTNFVFVELPLTVNPEYIPEALNKLLYSCKLSLIFTEFQSYLPLYDPLEIEKMLRIKNSAFQFNIKNSFEPQNIKIIKKILKNNNTVLLGTGCTHDYLNIKEIKTGIEKLKKAIGEKTFLEIILKAKRFLS